MAPLKRSIKQAARDDRGLHTGGPSHARRRGGCGRGGATTSLSAFRHIGCRRCCVLPNSPMLRAGCQSTPARCKRAIRMSSPSATSPRSGCPSACSCPRPASLPTKRRGSSPRTLRPKLPAKSEPAASMVTASATSKWRRHGRLWRRQFLRHSDPDGHPGAAVSSLSQGEARTRTHRTIALAMTIDGGQPCQ